MVQTMLGLKRVDGAKGVTGRVERGRRRPQHLVPASLAEVERTRAAGLAFVPAGRRGGGEPNHMYIMEGSHACMRAVVYTVTYT